MRVHLAVLIILIALSNASGQNWSMSSAIGTSYSGINHHLSVRHSIDRLNLSVGPSFNYSKNKFPWSATPGANINGSYHLNDSSKVQTSVMLNYLLVPIREANIHEVNLGYTIQFTLSPHWQATNTIGFGGYAENAQDYSINGFSYCINFGLLYRL